MILIDVVTDYRRPDSLAYSPDKSAFKLLCSEILNNLIVAPSSFARAEVFRLKMNDDNLARLP